MGILSALSADDIRFAVLSGDEKTITKAPGIGKKTAQADPGAQG
ncbi:MAG: helix-hairpin-helix domain-containing protein [Lachnospiraceae bacterium]